MQNRASSFDCEILHQRSFHLVRLLCLVALIAVHALSFNNRAVGRIFIPSLTGYQLYFVLGALNSLFVFLAGVTLRLQLESEIVGSRLRRRAFIPVLEMLFLLLCIDLLKNHLLYNSPSVILEWDFLHTLVFSWIAIYFFSRIHIGLNLVVAGCIAWFNPQLREFLLSLELTADRGWPPLDKWNAYHDIASVTAVCIALGLVVILWRKPWPPIVRWPASALIALFAASMIKKIAFFEPTFFEYQIARNFWIYGLVGDRSHNTLMPLFAWGPSALVGFAGMDLVKKNSNLWRLNPVHLLIVSGAIAFSFIYLLLLRYDPQFIFAGLSTWNTVGNSETTFAGEIMKIGYFGFFYGGAWWLLSKIHWPVLDTFSEKFSRATFWIYILATASTQVLATQLQTLSSQLWINFLITFTIALLLSAVLAEGIAFFTKRKISFYLRKADP